MELDQLVSVSKFIKQIRTFFKPPGNPARSSGICQHIRAELPLPDLSQVAIELDLLPYLNILAM